MVRKFSVFAVMMSLGMAATAYGEPKSDEEQLLARAERSAQRPRILVRARKAGRCR